MSREYRALLLEAKGSLSQDLRERALTEESGRQEFRRSRSYGLQSRRRYKRKKPSGMGLLPKRGLQRSMAKRTGQSAREFGAAQGRARAMVRGINASDTRFTPGSIYRSEAARAGIFRADAGRHGANAWRLGKISGYLQARGQRGRGRSFPRF